MLAITNRKEFQSAKTSQIENLNFAYALSEHIRLFLVTVAYLVWSEAFRFCAKLYAGA
jgi:hypothetical protein